MRCVGWNVEVMYEYRDDLDVEATRVPGNGHASK